MKKFINLCFYLLCFFFVTSLLYAQEEVSTKKVIIGLKLAPPFVELSDDGYQGLSIESWQIVNDQLKWDYEFKEYKTLPELLDAVKNREVDFSINPITVTANRMNNFSFTQPYFISNTVVARLHQNTWWNTVVNMLTWRFISAVALLAGVIFIFGFFVWLFERRKNPEFKGKNKWSGVWQGFWWSAVTMTTVGYGDKAPQTTGGRVIGLIWMFMAVIIISSLTAGIASALTVQNLSYSIKSVEDLSKYEIETLAGSSSQEFLDAYHISYRTVNTVKQGLLNVENKKTQLFIYDQPLIRYELEALGLTNKITILPQALRKDYFSYCFPLNSGLINNVNPVLISSIKTLEWMSLIKKYQDQQQ